MSKKMWMSTPWAGDWVECPLRGADMSPRGWEASGEYLSGGGYAINSSDSHREFNFEWKGASSLEAADTIQKFRDGWFSRDPRDLIYFLDPFAKKTNVLPKRWAQPSIMLESTVSGELDTGMGRIQPFIPSSTASGEPLRGVNIVAPSTPVTTVHDPRALFIPAAPGEPTPWVFFKGDPVGAGSGIFLREVYSNGTLGAEVSATYSSGFWDFQRHANSGTVRGVIIYVKGEINLLWGGTSYKFQSSPTVAEKYTCLRPGMGTSGCRFVGNPTLIGNNAVINGGMVGFAATLKEIGDWVR